MSLRAALALAASLAALVASPASAYWQAGGTGTALALVDTLGTGNQPAVSAVAATVTVQWAQTPFQGSPLGGYAGGGYVVRRYPAGGGAAITPGGGCGAIVSGSAATLSCQEPGVAPGSWQYTVAPVVKTWTGGESPKSAAVAVASVAPSLTSAVAQNPAAGQSTGAVQIDWIAVAGATGYNVYRRAGGGAYNFSAPLNGATPLSGASYTDPGAGLTGGTSYSYVVRAVTGGAESASSNELAATAIARPPAPAGATATPAPAAAVAVSWPAVGAASGYNVYRRTLAGAYNYGAPLNGATPRSGTSYADVTAVDGASYRYVIRAVITGAGGAQVESSDSPESTLVTADGVSPSSVTIVNPGSPLRAAVTLSGTASDAGSGIASLRFQYTAAGGSSWTDGCSASTSPYSCSLNTATIADGLYDLRALATDVAGNATASATVSGRRIDNTAPVVTMNGPGAYLRATVTLTASATDAGSGVASTRIQRAPAGSSTWTDVCAAASCPLDTTTLADGVYDLRAVAIDVAGNTGTSAIVAGVVVDNTAPTGTDIKAANFSGGIAAKPEAGDVVTYTFSEPLLPASILAGWTGAATAVTVRFDNGNPDVMTIFDAANTAQIALGSFTSGKKYVTANTIFSGSTMVLSGSSVVVTLGTPSGSTAAAKGSTTLQWTVSTAATDLAGNPVTAATVSESGAADPDF
jgi:chitinase